MKLKSIIAAAALVAVVGVAQAQAGDVDYKAAADKYTAENHLVFESGEVVNGVYTFKAKDTTGAETSYTINTAGVVTKVTVVAPAATTTTTTTTVTPAAPAVKK